MWVWKNVSTLDCHSGEPGFHSNPVSDKSFAQALTAILMELSINFAGIRSFFVRQTRQSYTPVEKNVKMPRQPRYKTAGIQKYLYYLWIPAVFRLILRLLRKKRRAAKYPRLYDPKFVWHISYPPVNGASQVKF